MDDTAAGVAIGLVAALVLHGAMNRRAAHAAECQMSEAFTGSGGIHAVVREQAPFGIVGNDIWALDVYCHDVNADTVPFTQIRRSGWKGRIHHLRLHLSDCGIAGVRIGTLDADIPGVTYDLGHALYKDRLLIRGAGTGTVRLTIDQTNLEAFARRKYGTALNNFKAVLTGNRISISGKIKLLSSDIPFSVDGQIKQRAGRFLDITDAAVALNGVVVDATQAQGILDRINPVLDIKADLHLDQFIRIGQVTGNGSQLTIQGEISIPRAQPEIYGRHNTGTVMDAVSPAPQPVK